MSCADLNCAQYGSDYRQENNKCIKDAKCPTGYTMNGAMCYKGPKPLTCPSGYTLNDNICKECSGNNNRIVGLECRTDVVCPDNTYSHNGWGGCFKNANSCWDGQTRVNDTTCRDNTCNRYIVGSNLVSNRIIWYNVDGIGCWRSPGPISGRSNVCYDFGSTPNTSSSSTNFEYLSGAYGAGGVCRPNYTLRPAEYYSPACSPGDYLGGDGKCYRSNWDGCLNSSFVSNGGNGYCSRAVGITNPNSRCDDSLENWDGTNCYLRSGPIPGDVKVIDNPCPTKNYMIKNSLKLGVGVDKNNILKMIDYWSTSMKKFQPVNCNENGRIGYCRINFDDKGCISSNGSSINTGLCTGGNEQFFRVQLDGNIRWFNNNKSDCLTNDSNGNLTIKSCTTDTLWNIMPELPVPPSKTDILNKILYAPVITKFGNNSIIYQNNLGTYKIGDPTLYNTNTVSQVDCDITKYCRLNMNNKGCLYVDANNKIKTSICTGGDDSFWRYQQVDGSNPAVYKFHLKKDNTKCLSYNSNAELILDDCLNLTPTSINWN